ncbi:MAG: chemotaxis protein CheW, partial [Synergistaceae bacterium]|nr:chemotaxis protein CheW [Synergistaceae bacterium]
TFGMIVNSVREVLTIYDSQLEVATKLSSAIDRRYVLWVAKPSDDRLILLLDVSNLFELDQILEDSD